jgi:hypothetical protein
MKQTTVRGTPYTHKTVHGLEDSRGNGSPSENRGSTVHEQFREQGINTERRVQATPYSSENGNPADARREVLRSTNAESSDHGNQNDPRSNGHGVVLDGANSYERGYQPPHAPALDSPVPRDAPWFETTTIREEDRAHLGHGVGGDENAQDSLLACNGVMSRGLDSVSHPGESETELTRDDTLARPEAGTQKDVQGHAGRRIRE